MIETGAKESAEVYAIVGGSRHPVRTQPRSPRLSGARGISTGILGSSVATDATRRSEG
jgi:hypothetical protein